MSQEKTYLLFFLIVDENIVGNVAILTICVAVGVTLFVEVVKFTSNAEAESYYQNTRERYEDAIEWPRGGVA